MRFEFLAILYGLCCALPTFAGSDEDARAALALAGAGKGGATSPVPAAPLSYKDARARALWYDKPLVVWVGAGVCPGCIAKMEDEVVSCVVKDFEGVPEGGGLVVGVPDGTGDLTRVATITEWETGHATWGHVPSIRRALTAWRIRGLTQRAGWSRGMDRLTPPGMSPEGGVLRSMMQVPRFSAPRRGG
jgi:hypothetical protein